MSRRGTGRIVRSNPVPVVVMHSFVLSCLKNLDVCAASWDCPLPSLTVARWPPTRFYPCRPPIEAETPNSVCVCDAFGKREEEAKPSMFLQPAAFPPRPTVPSAAPSGGPPSPPCRRRQRDAAKTLFVVWSFPARSLDLRRFYAKGGV